MTSDWRSQRHCAAAFRAADPTPALVLAAGASVRFGRGKALARWQGRTLLDHAISQARRLSTDVRVITGCRGPLLQLSTHRKPTSWLSADHWQQGMSAALKQGVLTLPAAARGVFVVLVDQPLVTGEDLHRLREAAHRAPGEACAADYHGHPGVPAYLPRWLWPAVFSIEGDRGAGGILRAASARCLPIAGVTADVDTPADLAALRHRSSR